MRYSLTYQVKTFYDETDDWTEKYYPVVEVDADDVETAEQRGWDEVHRLHEIDGQRDYVILLKSAEVLYCDSNFDRSCRIIVPDFNLINCELMQHFARHPEDLERLHWRRFEEVLEAVFRNQGFRTVLGPGSGDQGIDLRLIQKDNVGELLTIVQAKRYKSDHPIRLEAVQALCAVVDDQKANRGLFVTTSRYFPSAQEFAKRQEHRLTLATPNDVARWCSEIVSAGGPPGGFSNNQQS